MVQSHFQYALSHTLSLFASCQSQKDDVKWMCHNSEQSGKIHSVCLCMCVREIEEPCGYELKHYGTVKVWIIESTHYFEMQLSFVTSVVLISRASEALGNVKCWCKPGHQHLWHERWDFVKEVALMQTSPSCMCVSWPHMTRTIDKDVKHKPAIFYSYFKSVLVSMSASHRSISGIAQGSQWVEREALSIYQWNIACVCFKWPH